jgi:hypothetical protein
VVPSRVLCMVYDPDGDAAAAVSAKRSASVPYTLREKIVSQELWAEFKKRSDTMLAWFGAPINVERWCPAIVESTLDGHARTLAGYLGFAHLVHGLQPSIQLLLNGPMIARFAAFLREPRGCAPATMVKQLGHIHNMLKFMQSKTGRCQVEPPLTRSEVTELEELQKQLAYMKKQLHGEAVVVPKATPAQLTSEGKWLAGGFQALQDAAASYGRAIVQLVPPPRLREELNPKAASTVRIAAQLNSAMLAMLVTALPPQRPRSLYSTRLVGAVGVDDPVHACVMCSRKGCRGNTLERTAPYTFVWVLSHHKTQKSACIPPQTISAAAHAHPVLLEVLEAVGHSLPRTVSNRSPIGIRFSSNGIQSKTDWHSFLLERYSIKDRLVFV